MGRQRAGANVMRLGASAAGLFVSALMKMPIGLQLRAAWFPVQMLADRGPGRLAMFGHVICGNLVRDPLETEVINQPVEQGTRIVSLNCGGQSWIPKVLEQIKGSRQTTDLLHQVSSIIVSIGIAVSPLFRDRRLTCTG